MTTYQRILAITLWLLTIALGLWVTNYHEILRYIFFLRVPIFAGILLVILPVVAIYTPLKTFLKNLFVLRSNRQLILVIVGTSLAGLSIVIVGNFILQNAHSRFHVSQLDWISKLNSISELLRYVIVCLLASPIIIALIWQSKEEIKERQQKPIWHGIIFGGGLTLSLLLTLNLFEHLLESNDFIQQSIMGIFGILPKLPKGYFIKDEPDPGIITLIAFFGLQLIIYVLGYILGKPKAKRNRFEPPTLVYIVIITSIMVLLLSGMSFFLDYSRVPLLLLFIVISATGYLIFNVDHFYGLKIDPNPTPTIQEWQTALNKRLHEYQKDNQVLVVVSTSGGGIQASGWTTTVLIGLQEIFGIEFTRSIGWISAVSGGSVGTMYYLDRFSDDGYPEHNDLEQIFRSSTEDSLDAVGWGLAYPDLLRFIGLPFLVPTIQDRGNAVEADWRGELKDPGTPPSLSTWREKVKNGIIPLPIFNASLVEDGRRFMISPMTFTKTSQLYSENAHTDFNTLYEGFDMDITTAARLSATFPYISPVSRPPDSVDGKKINNIFHVADGGYFDNYGVATSTLLLDQLLQENFSITKILFLEIHASPDPKVKNESRGSLGWVMEVIGAVKTLLGVRRPTQMISNAANVQLLKEKYKNVEIVDFIIAFPEPAENFDAQPLSWQLTEVQKTTIQRG